MACATPACSFHRLSVNGNTNKTRYVIDVDKFSRELVCLQQFTIIMMKCFESKGKQIKLAFELAFYGSLSNQMAILDFDN